MEYFLISDLLYSLIPKRFGIGPIILTGGNLGEKSGSEIGQKQLTFRLKLEAGESQLIDFAFFPIVDGIEPKRVSRDVALKALRVSYEEWAKR